MGPTRTELLPYETQVRTGMAWLDSNRPGWERKIDLSILDLGMPNCCILGQVDGHFWGSLRALDPHLEVATMQQAAARGFYVAFQNVDGHSKQYSQLTETWIALIKERFDQGLVI